MTDIQMALQSGEPAEWIVEITSRDPLIVEITVGLAFVALLFGGLPLAIFGLLFERQWAGVPTEQRPHLRVPYAILIVQIVSMSFSVLSLTVTGPVVLWALAREPVRLSVWFLPAYLVMQILASMAVIPVWRRLILNPPIRRGTLFPSRA